MKLTKQGLEEFVRGEFYDNTLVTAHQWITGKPFDGNEFLRLLEPESQWSPIAMAVAGLVRYRHGEWGTFFSLFGHALAPHSARGITPACVQGVVLGAFVGGTALDCLGENSDSLSRWLSGMIGDVVTSAHPAVLSPRIDPGLRSGLSEAVKEYIRASGFEEGKDPSDTRDIKQVRGTRTQLFARAIRRILDSLPDDTLSPFPALLLAEVGYGLMASLNPVQVARAFVNLQDQ